MNTHARGTEAAQPGYGLVATCCVALACAAYAYYALEPAATARETLDACVREPLAQSGEPANPAAVTATDREQARRAALYACSTQP